MAGEAPPLDFETAMKDFREMFPSLDRERIEAVLRKNDGHLAATIDELLAISNGDTPLEKQARPRLAQVHAYSLSSTHELQSSERERAGSSSELGMDELCRETLLIREKLYENERKLDRVTDEKEARNLEDEQLALMLQNKEFLAYLRRDPHVSREIFGDSRYSANRLGTRRRTVDVMERSDAPLVPDGPIVDPSRGSSKSSGWGKKLREKLGGRSSSTCAAYPDVAISRSEDFEQTVGADNFPHTLTLGYSHDGELKERLKNMSRASKTKLSLLARKFTRKEEPAGPARLPEWTTNAPHNGY